MGKRVRESHVREGGGGGGNLNFFELINPYL
jgi:hypothetical protein